MYPNVLDIPEASRRLAAEQYRNISKYQVFIKYFLF
jgi:hypothetical protein